MGWSRWGGIVAGILGAVFVYIASSPWLVWYSQPPAPHRLLVFSQAIPTAIIGETSQDFTSVFKRWKYVIAHSSGPAWLATVKTLALKPVPVQPAALLYAEDWFDEPTIVMATRQGSDIKFIAQQTDSPHPNPLPSLPTTHSVSLAVPGSALAGLPQPLQDTWNELLRARLGFTATAPDIISTIAGYSRVVIEVNDAGTHVGIVAGEAGEAERWAKMAEGWVVDEDRFRRPVTQAFRLPDRTVGHEIVAGLPGAVWGDASDAACRTPLPEKPALWLCQTRDQHILANHYWSGGRGLVTGLEWEMAMGPEFLTALPDIQTLHAWGSDGTAAGVITVGHTK